MQSTSKGKKGCVAATPPSTSSSSAFSASSSGPASTSSASSANSTDRRQFGKAYHCNMQSQQGKGYLAATAPPAACRAPGSSFASLLARLKAEAPSMSNSQKAGLSFATTSSRSISPPRNTVLSAVTSTARTSAAASTTTDDSLCFSVDEATCPICCEIIRGSVFETGCCGKLTCQSCARSDCFSRADSSCFNCRRKKEGGFSFRQSQFATRMFRQMKTKCKVCTKEVPLQELEDHMHPKKHYWLNENDPDVCPHAQWKCPHAAAGCGFSGRLSELKKHLAESCQKV